MVLSARFLACVGAVAAGPLAVVAFSTALAQADTTDPVTDPTFDPTQYSACFPGDGACLVMGDAVWQDWHYGGVRPWVTDWHNDAQLYNVTIGGPDSQALAGSYDVKVDDFWSPTIQVYQYDFGDFTQTAAQAAAWDAALAANPALDESWYGGMSGASVYDVTIGSVHELTMVGVGPHDMSYYVTTIGDMVDTLVVGDGGSANYIQFGDGDPEFLWNALYHPDLLEAEVPQWLIPADPFTGVDFDPSQYLGGDLIAGM